MTTIVYLQTKTDEVVNCPLNLCKFSNGRLAKMSHNVLKHSRSNTTEELFEHDERKKRPFHTYIFVAVQWHLIEFSIVVNSTFLSADTQKDYNSFLLPL